MKTRVVFLTSILLIIASLNAFSKTIVVTTGTDSIPGSLRDAVNKAQNGDIIIFDNDLAEIILGEQITIDKSITISGHPGLVVHDYIHPINLKDGILYTTTVHHILEINGSNQIVVNINNLKLVKNIEIFEDTVSYETSGKIFLVHNSNPSSIININFCYFTSVDKNHGSWRTVRHYAPNGALLTFNGQNGGAIAQDGAVLNISNCTFSNNVAGSQVYWGNGGALAQFSGKLNLLNCTFFGNTAGHLSYTNKMGSGSAIYSQNSNLSITNCTCAENLNSFSWTSGQNYYYGSTNTIVSSSSNVSIKNSILYNSYGLYEISGPITSGGYNIFTQLSVSGSVATDLFNCDPGFRLVNNGVVMDTTTFWIPVCALSTEGCAVNALPANGNGAPQYDQRGFLRVGTPDIGAYEFGGTSPSTGIVGKKENLVTIFPNPCNNFLFIDGITKKTIVSIYNVSGELVFDKRTENNYIDISKWAKGMYMIRINVNSGISTKKFVKQ